MKIDDLLINGDIVHIINSSNKKKFKVIEQKMHKFNENNIVYFVLLEPLDGKLNKWAEKSWEWIFPNKNENQIIRQKSSLIKES